MHGETDSIMNNLEEAIITKSFKGIGYCNKRGFKVINEIHGIVAKNKEFIDNNEFSSNSKKEYINRLQININD